MSEIQLEAVEGEENIELRIIQDGEHFITLAYLNIGFKARVDLIQQTAKLLFSAFAEDMERETGRELNLIFQPITDVTFH